MTDVLDAPTTPLGKPIKRTEDPRFITGEGNYLDDIKLASMTHMAILRSPYAHANIRSIDTVGGQGDARRRSPSSSAPTSRTTRSRWPGRPAAARASRTTSTRRGSSPPTASSGPARAWRRSSPRPRRRPTTRSRRSSSTGSRCRPSSTPRRRPQPGAPQLHENAPNNVVFEWTVGDKAGTDAAIDGAEVVVRQRIVNQRLIPNPMETRGDIGWYNPGTDEYTVWMSSQTPHIQRLLLAAFVTGIPEHKVRCISPDVGGAFGTKIFCYADMALTHVRQQGHRRPAGQVGRGPPRELPEHDPRPRPHHVPRDRGQARRRGHRAARQDARQPRRPPLDDRPRHPDDALRPRPVGLLQDPERLRRGHRRLHEHHVRRRLPRRRPARGDLRHRAGDGPLRRRDRHGPRRGPAPELHPARRVPVREPVRARDRVAAAPRSTSTPATTSRRWTRRSRWPATTTSPRRRPRPRPAASSSASGFSTYIEVCGVAPSKWIGAVGEGWGAAMWESSNIRVHLTGKVVVTMGTQPQGQGHETTYAQVVAHELGIPMEDVDRPALGHAGHAVRLRLVRQPHLVGRHDRGDQGGRARSRTRRARYAAHMLEAVADDIEIDGAELPRQGLARTEVKTIQEIAFALDLAFDAPEGMEPYLDETAYYDTPNCTWPFGTHIAIVEIDEETGHVDLVRYVAVDDVGKKINPMIVDGQLHGGIAQGVGQALWEGAVYSDEGQLLTGSMLDYALPRAVVVPEHRARRDGHAVAGQPARRQGRRRGRRDRQHGGRRQRRHRRARARSASATSTCRTRPRPCGAPSRPRREARHDPGGVRVPAPGHARRGAGRARRRRTAAKVIAGGHEPAAADEAAARAAPDTLIDIGRLTELKGVQATARRRLRDRRADDLRRGPRGHRSSSSPTDAILDIGDVQVRNRGTVGGAIAHADPASDLPALGLALDYSVVAPLGPRRAGRAARRVLRGRVPDRHRARRDPRRDPARPLPAGAGGAYRKLEQPASGYSIVGVAAVVAVERRRRSRMPGSRSPASARSPTGPRRSRRRWSARTARRRPSRPRPRTPPTA